MKIKSTGAGTRNRSLEKQCSGFLEIMDWVKLNGTSFQDWPLLGEHTRIKAMGEWKQEEEQGGTGN